MNNDSDTRVYDLPTSGMFRVRHRGSCVAVFNYCVADESGFFTKKQAKKLAIKFARKIEKSTVIETKMGIKLKRNNQSSMTNHKRKFKKGDLVRFINTGRHPEIRESLAEGSLVYVQEEEGMDRRILVKTGDGTHKRFPFYEFELVEETKHEVFVRYTRDEAIILFNYQPVLRIPTRYKLGDQEVDMCWEVEGWAKCIVEDLNEHVMLPDISKTKNENGTGKV